ncbi:myb-like protein AA [Lucilia cuprina]|uniref:myb-like protein AA n=1 Tax=Lucilia cuprina TaxID=7375 RepID=UPI001F05E9D6|nr:myb-like protein AA [Lucilia cuprina]
MTIIKFLILLLLSLMTSAATFEEYSKVDHFGGDYYNNAFKSFGRRLIRRRSTNQEKRDTSLSYAATNINNKEGTQVKTITVIKNSNDKNQKLKIDPKLHKNENWADEFKDNFDSYGIIPDVPDVDDLFEYVNKKHNNDKEKEKVKKNEAKNEDKKDFDDRKVKEETTTTRPSQKYRPKEMEKPVTEISSEISDEVTENMQEVEKIKGDAELLPSFNNSRLKVRESLISLNYSTPEHSVHQYFDNYVQLSPAVKAVVGYDYPKPCIHGQPVGSVAVATPSGKTYNIPGNNNSYINPYLAPALTRRPQIGQTTQSSLVNIPVFPINSLVPQLQQQQPNNNNNPNLNNFLPQQNSAAANQVPNNSLQPPLFQNNIQTNQQQQPATQQNQQQQPPQQGQSTFVSTSQRPYVSPNIRSGLSGVSRGPGSNLNGYQNQAQPGYRINTFNNAFRKPNLFRSRGLKY